MSERPTTTALYDPGRLPNGQFQKGHTMAKGWNDKASRKFAALRNAWYDATTAADMNEVQAELKKMCLTCANPDVKLKSIIYYLDRCLGKPVERLDIDVSAESRPAPLVDLSADEIQVLERVVQKTGVVYELPDSDNS